MEVLIRGLAAGAVLAACLAGQTPLAIPAWLVNYGDVQGSTRASAVLVESSYVAGAPAAEVVAHYRKLFEAAGLVFQPNPDGVGTVIRATAEPCELLIQIRALGVGSLVRVSCATKTAAVPMVAVRAAEPGSPHEARIAEMHEDAQRTLQKAEEDHRRRLQSMEKFDRPVYPRPKAPAPKLVWPGWLVRLDGGRLQLEKGVDVFGDSYLKSVYTTDADRKSIQSFYADLLNSGGYTVKWQTLTILAADRKGHVESESYPGANPGPKLVIGVDLTPVAGGIQVEVRMTSHP